MTNLSSPTARFIQIFSESSFEQNSSFSYILFGLCCNQGDLCKHGFENQNMENISQF